VSQPREKRANPASEENRQRKAARLGLMYGAGPRKQPLEATELTADTCCALGVHSQWCGCDAT